MGVEVCPVHIPEFKCFQPASIHVGVMFCDPQARGLKRKFAEDDTTELGELPDSRYSRQRQSVFNISMGKLSRFRQAPDPSLLRSVLICNTLRSIEQEMEREGIKINCNSGGSSFLPPINSQTMTLDPPPPPNSLHLADGHGFNHSSYSFEMESKQSTSFPSVMTNPVVMNESAFNNNSSSNSYCTDYDRCLVDMDTASGRITPFVRTVCERPDTGALWSDEGDRLTSLNWSSVLNFGSSGSTSGNHSCTATHTQFDGSASADNHFDTSNSTNSSSTSSISGDTTTSPETSLHTLMPPSTTTVPSGMSNLSITYSSSQNPSPNSSPTSGNTSPLSGTSPSSSGEDEIFGDIDLSLYDFDLLSPLSPPNVKMAPVSAEELMRSLSNNGDANTNSCSTGNYYKTEYFSEEREHVTPVRS